MSNSIEKSSMSFCHKNICINVSGRNAQFLLQAAVAILLLVGIAAIAKKN